MGEDHKATGLQAKLVAEQKKLVEEQQRLQQLQEQRNMIDQAIQQQVATVNVGFGRVNMIKEMIEQEEENKGE